MKSAALLKDFTEYCKHHPSERFWQALRNWCGWRFIFVCNSHMIGEDIKFIDTFYWEGKAK